MILYMFIMPLCTYSLISIEKPSQNRLLHRKTLIATAAINVAVVHAIGFASLFEQRIVFSLNH